MGGWVLAAGGARCPYRAEGEAMRGRVVGSVGAGVSGLGRGQAWAWAREPDGDSGLQLQGLLFVAAEKAFDRAAGMFDGLGRAAALCGVELGELKRRERDFDRRGA